MNTESSKTLKFEDLKVGQTLQSKGTKLLYSVTYVSINFFVLKSIKTGQEQGYHGSFSTYYEPFVEPRKVKAYLYFVLDKRLVVSGCRPSHRLCYDRGQAEIECKKNEKNFFMSTLIPIEIEILLVG